MAHLRRWALASIASLQALTGCFQPTVGAQTASGSEAPPWLPPYTREQLSLLEPLGEAPELRALRAYPHESHFQYAHDRTLADPAEAMRTTKLVTELVAESARTYLLSDTEPQTENRIAQYGPPPAGEPDASRIASKDFQGRVELRKAELSSEAEDALADGRASFERKEATEAIAAFKRSADAAPFALEPLMLLAQAHKLGGQRAAAEQTLRQALELDRTFATTHLHLATLLFEKGDTLAAKESLAQALAYHPDLKPGLALANRIRELEGIAVPERIKPYRIFLEVDDLGVVRAGTGPTSGARMYAGCRAIMRYELELRAALFDEPESAPYFLSAAEEMFCVESAIGAYVAERAISREARRELPQDETAEGLTALAHTEGLLGYIMFEILGNQRPEVARKAPGFVHRAMVAYVKRHILGYEPSPEYERNYVERLDASPPSMIAARGRLERQ
jgi:tetratricopeptide (TPR) repeat protein